jgi:tetratricopeptide (TPR) repeat protein
LHWQGLVDEVISVGEEGLALLGDDTESVEAGMMNAHLAGGYGHKGDRSRSREFLLRNAQFLRRLSYSEELDWAYANVAEMHASEKNLEEAMNWLQALERAARQHHDLKAVAQMHCDMGGSILAPSGDLRGALSETEQAHELYKKTGDFKLGATCLARMGHAFLSLGDLRAAEEHLSRALEIQERVGLQRFTMRSLMWLGTVALCQGRAQRGAAAFQKVIHLEREIGGRGAEAGARHGLGRAYLAQEEREEALREFRVAITLATEDPSLVALALSGTDKAYDNVQEFRVFCHHLREEFPEFRDAAFNHWYLEPDRAHDFSRLLIDEEFKAPLAPGWVWLDPFGDCRHTVGSGLEIHAANGRALWHLNLSAPRLLQPASGDFAVQTICLPVSEEKPAIGGLLIWKDKGNFLLLDRGVWGKYDICFSGCLEDKETIIGRGRLPVDRMFLRLERLGSRVNALCSVDGQDWFTVGQVMFPVDDPVEVGLHAIGNIDRLIYPGAFLEGTAIRFESFELCD